MFILWNIWYAKTRRWVEIYEVCTILYFILFYSRLLYTYCCTLIEPKRSLILKNCSQTIIRTTLTVNMQYRIHSSTYTVNQMNSWVTKPKTSGKFCRQRPERQIYLISIQIFAWFFQRFLDVLLDTAFLFLFIKCIGRSALRPRPFPHVLSLRNSSFENLLGWLYLF